MATLGLIVEVVLILLLKRCSGNTLNAIDLFRPAFTASIGWALAFGTLILTDYEINFQTFICIVIFNLLFLFPSIILFKKVEITKQHFRVDYWVCFVLIAAQLLALMGALGYFSNAISVGDSTDMADLRRTLTTDNASTPLIYKLLNMFYVFNFINLIIFFKNRKMLFLSVFLGISYYVILMQRDGIIKLCFFLALTYTYSNNTSIPQILKRGIVVLPAVFVLLFSIIVFRGEEITNIISSLKYFSSGIVGLDAFLNGYQGESFVLESGQEMNLSGSGFSWLPIEYPYNTFTEILTQYFNATEKTFYIPINAEYVIFDAHPDVMTNIYTIIRGGIEDFGFLGLVLFPMFLGLVYAKIWTFPFANNQLVSISVKAYIAYVSFRMFGSNVFSLREFILLLLFSYIVSTFVRERTYQSG